MKLIKNTILTFLVTSCLPGLFARDGVFMGQASPTFQPWHPFESSEFNPGAGGFIQRFGIFGYYDYSGASSYIKNSLLLPISTGNLQVQYNRDLKNGPYANTLNLAYSKSYRDVFSLGIQTIYEFDGAGGMNFGLNPGFVYKGSIPGRARTSGFFHGWYLYSNLKSMLNAAPLWNLGFGFNLYQGDNIKTQLLAELKAPDFASGEYPVLIAWNFAWKFLSFYSGYYFSNVSARDALFGAGLGISPQWGGSLISIHYGMNTDSTLSNFHHFVYASALLNFPDKKAPVVEIRKQNSYFSPNWDGNKDVIWFQITVKERSRVSDWRLDILDAEGEIVKSFFKDKREKIPQIQFDEVFAGYFVKKVYEHIPHKILWDGTGNGTYSQILQDDKKAFHLPDGKYEYRLIVTDSFGNESAEAKGNVYIDTKAPYIDLYTRRNFIKMGGEDSSYSIVISHMTKNEPDIHYSARIVDVRGNEVRRYKWKKNPPRNFEWKGELENGEKAEPGVYRYVFRAVDRAGNFSEKESDPFYLVSGQGRLAYIEADRKNFNPETEEVVMRPFIDRKRNFDSWRIVLAKSKPGKERQALKIVQEWNGDKNDFPEELRWGKTQQPDGDYEAWLEVNYSDAETVISPSLPLVLDAKAPAASVSVGRSQFSPDGDGVFDQNFFSIRMQDPSGVESYTLRIYEIIPGGKDPLEKVFREWSGSGSFNGKIYWDGISDEGLFVQSSFVYKYQLIVTDRNGNRKITPKQRLHSDILFFNEKSHLKVIISAADFYPNSDKLKPRSIPAINRFVKLIARYPMYRIRVEVHAATGGNVEENLRLSERRAKSVMLLLQKKGIPSDRLAYQGMGEVRPIRDGDSPGDSFVNERVELILIR